MDIRFVQRDEIDKVKWNSCVHYSNNGNFFGYIWYLDTIAKEWDALVEGDYESVFPLITRTKYWKVKELYQPDLIRDITIYSINVLSEARITAFLNAIPKDLKYINIRVDEQLIIPDPFNFTSKTLNNQQLLLNASYDELAARFSPTLVQALEKSRLANLIPTTSIKPEQIVDFYKAHTPNRKNLERRYHGYLRIMYNVLHRGMGFGSGVQNKNGELLAVSFYIYSHSRVYNLLSAVSPKGKQVAADAQLFDTLLKTHAGKMLVLDFNSPSIGKEFGAIEASILNIIKDKRTWGVF